MAISDRSVLCVYRYDPLDRLADCLAAGQGSARFFYQKNRLATQIQGQIQHSLLRTDEHLLAQRRTEDNQSDSALLLTDQQQSVIAAQGLALAYTPYGHRHPSAGPMNLPGFTGQRVDPVTGHYLLGNGYRAFNPVLMRFNSPDSLSPFGEGGLNAYAYCEGDPVNRVDPSGHVPKFLKRFVPVKRLKLSNRINLGEGLDIYTQLKKTGERTLVVNAHGFPPSVPEFPALKIKNGDVSPELLYYRIKQKKINIDDYESIHVVSCYSGDSGAGSFANNLAALTGLPVKGYIGRVVSQVSEHSASLGILRSTHRAVADSRTFPKISRYLLKNRSINRACAAFSHGFP
ncbi:RHS repeat-associated core domain-containing protein, partial [Pseudomonas avellanae]